MKYTRKQISNLIESIYDGTVTERMLPVELYSAISEYFLKGLHEGFGMSLGDAAGKDYELLAELTENIYMFSSAKTYTQVKEMNSLIKNEDGEVKTFANFYKDASETFELYNKDYALTEYNTCLAQAQNAVKWNEIEKNKKLFPNLRYSAVIDDNTSDICLALDGLVAPVNDEIWNSVYPENHFQCRCVVLQEDSDIELTPDDEKEIRVAETEDKMQDLFKMNAGKDGYVFKDDHPYFQVEKKDRDFARENFGLPIPKNEE